MGHHGCDTLLFGDTTMGENNGRRNGSSRGRPSKFSWERAEAIVKLVREGASRAAAAAGAGIDESTLYDWVKRFPEFSQCIKKAHAEAEMKMVEVITSAAKDHWQAAAWWLERRHPKAWGRPQQPRVGSANSEVSVSVVYEKYVGAVRAPLGLEETPECEGIARSCQPM